MTLIFLVLALVIFLLAAIGVPSPPRFNLIAAGLAAYIASLLAGQLVR